MSQSDQPPELRVTKSSAGIVIEASGTWVVREFAETGLVARLNRDAQSAARDPDRTSWNLAGITRLDHIGAQFFWNLWGKKRPARLTLGERQDEIFDRLFHLPADVAVAPPSSSLALVRALGAAQIRFAEQLLAFIILIGQLAIDLSRLAARPHKGPWSEISANVFRAGAQALGITALVGFLIGIVLSYLSSQQLHLFGADVYIVDLLGMAIIRELGPVLAAILVAGRSGSAITAQLGVMRVTEELDAMLVMGIPHGFRLIMPRAVGLAIAMPLLVVWTDIMALLGGMTAASLSIGISYNFFLHALPAAVPIANLWLGVGKGVVFGILISLVACHFGLRIQPNTRSLGEGTTSSVVTAITVVIIADAVFAVVFQNVGF